MTLEDVHSAVALLLCCRIRHVKTAQAHTTGPFNPTDEISHTRHLRVIETL
jgi:hypothetical protein